MKVGGFLLGYVYLGFGIGFGWYFPETRLFRFWFGRFGFMFTRVEGLNHEEVS